jgi:hypothetical protein
MIVHVILNIFRLYMQSEWEKTPEYGVCAKKYVTLWLEKNDVEAK